MCVQIIEMFLTYDQSCHSSHIHLTPANGSDAIFCKASCLIFDYSKCSHWKIEKLLRNEITSGCGVQELW